jgi:hypothetical protein
VLPLPEVRPVETPAASPPATAVIDVPDAVLPIPEARPAEPAAAMLRLPTPRPPAAREAAPDLPPSPKRERPRSSWPRLTPPSGESEEKTAAGRRACRPRRQIDPARPDRAKAPVHGARSGLGRFARSGAVQLSTKTILNDRMAETVAKWVHEEVVPAARDILVGELTDLRVLDSCSCRGRGNIAGAKISEHGFANAIDIGLPRRQALDRGRRRQAQCRR